MRILYTLLYFLVFTPAALLMRAFGAKGLETRLDDRRQSYWLDRSPRERGLRSLKSQR